MFSCDLMRFLLTYLPLTHFSQMINLLEAAQDQLRKMKHDHGVSTTILFMSPTWTAAFTSALLQLFLTLASPPGSGFHMVSKWSTLADLSFSPDSVIDEGHAFRTAGSLRRFMKMIMSLENSFFFLSVLTGFIFFVFV